MSLVMCRLPYVQKKLAQSRSTIYKSVSDGLLPVPVQMGVRCVAWPEDELDAVIAARISGKTQEQIKALVARLVAARAGASARAAAALR